MLRHGKGSVCVVESALGCSVPRLRRHVNGLIGGSKHVKNTYLLIRVSEKMKVFKGLAHKEHAVKYDEAVSQVREKMGELHEGGSKILSVQVSTTSNTTFDNYMHAVITHTATKKKKPAPVLEVFKFKSWDELRSGLAEKMAGKRLISVSVDHQTRASKKDSTLRTAMNFMVPYSGSAASAVTPKQRFTVFLLVHPKK